MAAGVDRDETLLAGLPGLLLLGVAGLALRSPPLAAVTTSAGRTAEPDPLHEHTLPDSGGPNWVPAVTAEGCCLSHNCNLYTAEQCVVYRITRTRYSSGVKKHMSRVKGKICWNKGTA
jgi:hypothetical protein